MIVLQLVFAVAKVAPPLGSLLIRFVAGCLSLLPIH
jgi:hypothetical protein